MYWNRKRVYCSIAFLLVLFVIYSVVLAWFNTPNATETRQLAKSVHFNVAKSHLNEVYLIGNSAEYSLNTSLANVSNDLINAIVLSEDRRFFERGVIYIPLKAIDAFLECGIARVKKLGWTPCSGNSTITQQLTKLLLVSDSRSLKRKYLEMVWAIKLELTLSKNEILEMYLNRIPLGGQLYGVELAARQYFGKRAYQLNLYESAIIAGAVRRPSRNWNSNRLAAIERGNIVLNTLYRNGYTDSQLTIPNSWKDREDYRRLSRPYFGHGWSWIKPNVIRALAGQPAGRYKVYTTFNAEAHIYAFNAIREQTQKLQNRGIAAKQGSVVVMRPSGEVLAMVGGSDDSNASRFINRTVPIKGLHCRPAASLLKLVVYTAALEKGIRLDDEIDASPYEFTDKEGRLYRPLNHDGKTYSTLSLQQAYVDSVNTATVRLLADEIGYKHWFSVAERYGLPIKNFPRELGVALGQPEVCMIDLIRPFGIIASNGRDSQPHALASIVNKDGQHIYQYRTKRYRKFRKSLMRNVRYLSEQVVQDGTGTLAARNLNDLTIGGKTGTSDGFLDAWFIGYTNTIVIGVWIGNDTPISMPEVYGGTSAALVFNEVMSAMNEYTDILAE